MGTAKTGGAFRCAKLLIFKEFQETFSTCTVKKKKILFKLKLTAAVSAFSASDIICLWGKLFFYFSLFWGTLWRKKLRPMGTAWMS